MSYGLVVNLDRCVGCHTCEISCKQENKLPVGTRWVEVKQVGPKNVEGETCMDFVHVVHDGCNLCRHRMQKGLQPACVVNCPTDALMLLGEEDILKAIRDNGRAQICKLIDASIIQLCKD